ncbi:MAG: hypothetical protein WKG00_11795 [Polyangiaceae bacterium]
MARPRRLPSAALAVLLGTAALSVAAPAAAQTAVKEPSKDELKIAKEMLAEAATEVKAGHCEDALTILKQVAAIKESGELHLYTGECQAKAGHLAQALSSYETGLLLAKKNKDKVTEKTLTSRVADLKGRVPTVTLQMPADAEDAKVQVDGEEIAGDKLGGPIPLEAGEHTIVVTAPGRKRFEKVIDVAEKDTATVAVELPRTLVTDPGEGQGPTEPGTDEGKDEGKKSPPIPLATWIGGGAAVVLVVGGILSFAAAGGKASDGETCALAGDTACADDARSSVRTLDGLALGMWIGAGVAAGTAVTFYVLSRNEAPADAAKASTGRVVPVRPRSGIDEARIVVGPGSVRLVGSF